MLMTSTTLAVVSVLLFAAKLEGARLPLAVMSASTAQFDRCVVHAQGYTGSWCPDGTNIFCCKAKISENKYAGCCREVLTCSGGGWWELCCYGVVSYGAWTANGMETYCTSLGLAEPNSTVWAGSAGPFQPGQAPYPGNIAWAGQVPAGPAGSSQQGATGTSAVGKVTVDDEPERPIASANVPATAANASGGSPNGAGPDAHIDELEKDVHTVKESLDTGLNDASHGLEGLSKLLQDIKKVPSIPANVKKELNGISKSLGRLSTLTDKAGVACLFRCFGCALKYAGVRDFDCMGDCAWNPAAFMTC